MAPRSGVALELTGVARRLPLTLPGMVDGPLLPVPLVVVVAVAVAVAVALALLGALGVTALLLLRLSSGRCRLCSRRRCTPCLCLCKCQRWCLQR